MTKKILHLAGGGAKFIPPFIKTVNDNFRNDEHEFIITSEITSIDKADYTNVCLPSKKSLYFLTLFKMYKADKIILHSLCNPRIILILFFSPWLLKKSYWIIWGADLYLYQCSKRGLKWRLREFFRRFVIKNIGHLVTYVEGDVQLARKWYGSKGVAHECFMYTSNLYKHFEIPTKENSTINIQVGNSADPSNNHMEVLERLLSFKDEDICIYLPLAYGSSEYAEQVISKGIDWFGDKFKPLTKLMPLDEYINFLGTIDIAIFNHKRQQAMGNTITLLGLGKTVYLRCDTTQWELFRNKNIDVKDVNKFDSLNVSYQKENVKIIKEYFSQNNYLKQLTELFN